MMEEMQDASVEEYQAKLIRLYIYLSLYSIIILDSLTLRDTSLIVLIYALPAHIFYSTYLFDIRCPIGSSPVHHTPSPHLKTSCVLSSQPISLYPLAAILDIRPALTPGLLFTSFVHPGLAFFLRPFLLSLSFSLPALAFWCFRAHNISCRHFEAHLSSFLLSNKYMLYEYASIRSFHPQR
ncbi:hypothetical protein FA13DRAFT_514220 [Coprinellus micaceus]|uniref:Uncharacterized protein n=1 Tax=Coprinellus micaceus TaxID=71717 RepID=A0A4Y7SBB2_COPMI|nr:hypothetical protein FA13DRAFT_514220 [Coprinellus micaceus]